MLAEMLVLGIPGIGVCLTVLGALIFVIPVFESGAGAEYWLDAKRFAMSITATGFVALAALWRNAVVFMKGENLRHIWTLLVAVHVCRYIACNSVCGDATALRIEVLKG